MTMNEIDDGNQIDEDPLESDLEEFGDDDSPRIECCGGCGADVFDDSVQCPVCGQYIFSTEPITDRDRKTWAWVLTAVVVLAAFVWYILV